MNEWQSKAFDVGVKVFTSLVDLSRHSLRCDEILRIRMCWEVLRLRRETETRTRRVEAIVIAGSESLMIACRSLGREGILCTMTQH